MFATRGRITSLEGWSLFGYFLQDYLAILTQRRIGEERSIDDIWAHLVGRLYITKFRTDFHDDDDAARMQKIIDMVVEQDITDPNVREEIHRNFNDMFEQMRIGVR